MRKLRALPIFERPREKLQRRGSAALSDFELLEVIIGSGNRANDVSHIARQVQGLLGTAPGNVSLEALLHIKGVSHATASKILASLELARRYLTQDLEPVITLQDVLHHLAEIRAHRQEHLVSLSLDGGRRLIAQRTITIGTLDTLLAHPREVFSNALSDRAASIIIGHNHPSGQPNPSQQDQALTQQLVAVGQLVGIPLRDHVIVTKSAHYSFRQHHLM